MAFDRAGGRIEAVDAGPNADPNRAVAVSAQCRDARVGELGGGDVSHRLCVRTSVRFDRPQSVHEAAKPQDIAIDQYGIDPAIGWPPRRGHALDRKVARIDTVESLLASQIDPAVRCLGDRQYSIGGQSLLRPLRIGPDALNAPGCRIDGVDATMTQSEPYLFACRLRDGRYIGFADVMAPGDAAE